ncbi:hypothetical protein BDY19DRAFT_987498 [Irpex rosettiformis]|uniref:Uncharacterized protein n=1 Tax=Irpex rosettiformis TaxID=378272 RepID=A0ACB8TQX6_9APHY|nr:hypothetical protein BDY19DRAFT_987498 [Irpex rosettiformis]
MPETSAVREALERVPLLRQSEENATEVYPVIQSIRNVNTPLTFEALTAPDLTYTLVRPLEDKYNALQRKGNLAIVFCFLLNRAYFVRDRNLTTVALSRTRAMLCEILAIRALRSHAGSMLELALALTTSWPVYSGADPDFLARARDERDDDLEDRVGNAIEIAIISQSKLFIKSSACQRVIDGIWSGKIVYQATSSRSILSDTYKRTPIHFYDPHKAPLLDHYRLKVPAVRSVLEYLNFLILFILFIFALEFNQIDNINIAEGVFMIYALGFTLEKVAAMQEHGIKVYFKGTWNGFDLAFVTFFCTYAVLRLYGVYYNHHWSRTTGIDFLALIAVLMFPRLAFVTLKNNLMVLSLRAMIVQFVILMFIAAFCFGGFLYALWTLSRNEAGQISWWMLDLYFGLDATGFEKSMNFHPVFGPFLMVTYACLSNTLLLTVLILSYTFTTINDDAAAEAMFRRAVSTIEGVKADSLFSYQPPVNLIALCIMLPASYILNPRWFHKVNVFMIRLTSFPILLLIALYERQAKRTGALTFYETVSAAAEKVFDTLPRGLKRLSLFEGLAGADADIDAIFELEESEAGDIDESALDMAEAGPIPPIDIRARRMSQASRRPRVSLSSTHSQGNGGNGANPSVSRSSPSSSPRKAEQSSPSPSNIPLPRARLTSLATRLQDMGQSAPSPLAQVFQPLIVNEEPSMPDISEVPQQLQQFDFPSAGIGAGIGGPPPSVISYGPATRRRLSSMVQTQQQQHRRGFSTATSDSFFPQSQPLMAGGQPSALGLATRRPAAGRNVSGGLSNLASEALSESPDAHTGPTETASEVEEEGPESTIEKRLDRMDSRQQRIEDLLVQLIANLGRKK